MSKRRLGLLAFACALAVATFAPAARAADPDDDAAAGPARIAVLHAWYGTVKEVRGTELYLQLRTGKVISIDARQALADPRSVLLTPTRPVIVRGTTSGGVIHAQLILRSHSMPAYWPQDR